LDLGSDFIVYLAETGYVLKTLSPNAFRDCVASRAGLVWSGVERSYAPPHLHPLHTYTATLRSSAPTPTPSPFSHDPTVYIFSCTTPVAAAMDEIAPEYDVVVLGTGASLPRLPQASIS